MDISMYLQTEGQGDSNITLNRLFVGGIISDSYHIPIKAPVVFLSKKLYSNCLVLVSSGNRFVRDLHKQKLLVSQSN